jgi:adenosylcobyric acid synthase
LLNIDTVIAPEKTLSQSAGTHLQTGLSVSGYEIHHGKTAVGNGKVTIEIIGPSGKTEIGGVSSPEGLV